VAAVESTTLLGGAIGFFFVARSSALWLGLVMAHIGGGFLYLAVHAVSGEMMKHGKGLVMTSFLGGFSVIAVLNLCLRLLAP
jgi:zinc transporter ZupT